MLLAAAALFAVIVILRAFVPGNRDELLGLMFVLPVGFIGFEFGVRAGLAMGLGALTLVALDPAASDPRIDALGLVTRAVVFLAVGGLAGRFSDRMWANQRHLAALLTIERQRSALQSELQHAYRRLDDQIRNAGYVLDHHERERRGIAQELHEQAAQTMAAVLLVVGRLQRDIADGLTQTQLERVRDSVRSCIFELRRLAGSLRSPVLEELGLVPALERLVEYEQQERSRTIELRIERLPPLGADLEISAYRIIEELLQAQWAIEERRGVGPTNIAVSLEADAGSSPLRITIGCLDCSACMRELEQRLATTRARLEMLGGSLYGSHRGTAAAITAELPLTSPLADPRNFQVEPAPEEHSPPHSHS